MQKNLIICLSVLFTQPFLSCGIYTKTVAHTPQAESHVEIEGSQKEWVQPTFQGLLIGKSNEKQVRKLFGTPIWNGPPEDEVFENDSEGEILMEYKNVLGADGQVSVTIGVQSRTVLALAFYPKSAVLNDIKKEYGSDYIELDSYSAMCQDNKPVLVSSRKQPNEYPYVILYAKKGIYVLVNEDFSVNHIGFLSRCLASQGDRL